MKNKIFKTKTLLTRSDGIFGYADDIVGEIGDIVNLSQAKLNIIDGERAALGDAVIGENNTMAKIKKVYAQTYGAKTGVALAGTFDAEIINILAGGGSSYQLTGAKVKAVVTDTSSVSSSVNAQGNIEFTSTGSSYVLPQATASDLGGVKAGIKLDTDTAPVHIDADGLLWTTGNNTSGEDAVLRGKKVQNSDAEKSLLDTNEDLVTKEYADAHYSGSSYVLPVANSTTLGGVKADAKTSAETLSIKVDADGKLWTVPNGGTGGDGVWGSITGNIADQEDLVSLLGEMTYKKANMLISDTMPGNGDIYNNAVIDVISAFYGDYDADSSTLLDFKRVDSAEDATQTIAITTDSNGKMYDLSVGQDSLIRDGKVVFPFNVAGLYKLGDIEIVNMHGTQQDFGQALRTIYDLQDAKDEIGDLGELNTPARSLVDAINNITQEGGPDGIISFLTSETLSTEIGFTSDRMYLDNLTPDGSYDRLLREGDRVRDAYGTEAYVVRTEADDAFFATTISNSSVPFDAKAIATQLPDDGTAIDVKLGEIVQFVYAGNEDAKYSILLIAKKDVNQLSVNNMNDHMHDFQFLNEEEMNTFAHKAIANREHLALENYSNIYTVDEIHVREPALDNSIYVEHLVSFYDGASCIITANEEGVYITAGDELFWLWSAVSGAQNSTNINISDTAMLKWQAPSTGEDYGRLLFVNNEGASKHVDLTRYGVSWGEASNKYGLEALSGNIYLDFTNLFDYPNLEDNSLYAVNTASLKWEKVPTAPEYSSPNKTINVDNQEATIDVSVSSDSGNAIKLKNDGLYVQEEPYHFNPNKLALTQYTPVEATMREDGQGLYKLCSTANLLDKIDDNATLQIGVNVNTGVNYLIHTKAIDNAEADANVYELQSKLTDTASGFLFTGYAFSFEYNTKIFWLLPSSNNQQTVLEYVKYDKETTDLEIGTIAKDAEILPFQHGTLIPEMMIAKYKGNDDNLSEESDERLHAFVALRPHSIPEDISRHYAYCASVVDDSGLIIRLQDLTNDLPAILRPTDIGYTHNTVTYILDKINQSIAFFDKSTGLSMWAGSVNYTNGDPSDIFTVASELTGLSGLINVSAGQRGMYIRRWPDKHAVIATGTDPRRGINVTKAFIVDSIEQEYRVGNVVRNGDDFHLGSDILAMEYSLVDDDERVWVVSNSQDGSIGSIFEIPLRLDSSTSLFFENDVQVAGRAYIINGSEGLSGKEKVFVLSDTTNIYNVTAMALIDTIGNYTFSPFPAISNRVDWYKPLRIAHGDYRYIARGVDNESGFTVWIGMDRSYNMFSAENNRLNNNAEIDGRPFFNAGVSGGDKVYFYSIYSTGVDVLLYNGTVLSQGAQDVDRICGVFNDFVVTASHTGHQVSFFLISKTQEYITGTLVEDEGITAVSDYHFEHIKDKTFLIKPVVDINDFANGGSSPSILLYINYQDASMAMLSYDGEDRGVVEIPRSGLITSAKIYRHDILALDDSGQPTVSIRIYNTDSTQYHAWGQLFAREGNLAGQYYSAISCAGIFDLGLITTISNYKGYVASYIGSEKQGLLILGSFLSDTVTEMAVED